MSEIDNNAKAASSGGISETLREQLHRREDWCRELEALAASARADYDAEFDRIAAGYAAEPELPPEFAELLDKRFAEARKLAEAGREAAEARRQSVARLAADLDALLAAGELATLGEIEKLKKRFSALTSDGSEPAAELIGFNDKLAPIEARLAAEAAAEAKQSAAAQELIDELNALTAAEDIAPLHEKKNELEAKFQGLGEIQPKMQKAWQEAHRKASTRLARHYETLDLARWESYTRKLDLCAELEKLLQTPAEEMYKAAKPLTELRDKWKNLGSVPKEKNEEINARYLELTRDLQRRVDDFFTRRRQEHKQAAADKQALCESAAALADSTEWSKTAAEFKELQAKWKQLPNAGPQENTFYQQFRAAADKFFNARSAYFAERDRRFQVAVDAKNALIAEAEALTDPRRARQLREDYRNAGSAGRAESELFRRFNAALDKFFGARREAGAAREVKSRELVAEVEALTAAPGAEGAEARVRAIRDELRELACRATFDAEKQALMKFERAATADRDRVISGKFDAYKTACRAVAAAYTAYTAGNELPEAPADITRFPKLETALKLMASHASDRLEKLIVQTRAEYRRIVDELSGGAGDDAPKSLAAELEAAILGNFAKAEAKAVAKTADPRKLRSDFVNSGFLPEAELDAGFAEIDAAFAKTAKR